MTQEQIRNYGISVSLFDRQVMIDVLTLYSKVILSRDVLSDYMDEAKDYIYSRTKNDITTGHSAEWRFGSRLGQSKLWAKRGLDGDRNPLVYFEFSSNTDLRNDQVKRQSEDMEERFRLATNEYLLQRGLGVPVVRPRFI